VVFGRLSSDFDFAWYLELRQPKLQCSMSSSGVAVAPLLSTTHALTASPRYESGMPITPASITAVREEHAFNFRRVDIETADDDHVFLALHDVGVASSSIRATSPV